MNTVESCENVAASFDYKTLDELAIPIPLVNHDQGTITPTIECQAIPSRIGKVKETSVSVKVLYWESVLSACVKKIDCAHPEGEELVT